MRSLSGFLLQFLSLFPHPVIVNGTLLELNIVHVKFKEKKREILEYFPILWCNLSFKRSYSNMLICWLICLISSVLFLLIFDFCVNQVATIHFVKSFEIFWLSDHLMSLQILLSIICLIFWKSLKNFFSRQYFGILSDSQGFLNF